LRFYTLQNSNTKPAKWNQPATFVKTTFGLCGLSHPESDTGNDEGAETMTEEEASFYIYIAAHK